MTAEYEPRHRAEIETLRIRPRIPPSLDYQTWNKDATTTFDAVYLWDAATGEKIANFDLHQEPTGITITLTSNVLKPEPSRAGHEWDSRSWFM